MQWYHCAVPAPFDPLDHDDYRALVRAWIAADGRRSQAGLARRVGVSRSTIAMVLNGARDIPLAAARQWAKALSLPTDQARYFAALVRADSPVSGEIRQQARAQLRSARAARKARVVTLEQARLLGRWYVPVIFELSRTVGFELDAAWLCARVWPEVPRAEMEVAVRLLAELGIVRLDDDGEVIVDRRPFVTEQQLPDEFSRIGTAYHHAQLEHAGQALDTQGPATRHVASLALALERTRLPELIEALHRFQIEVVEPFRTPVNADAVVQLSVQCFVRTPEPPE